MVGKIIKGQILYYARIFPITGTYEVDEIKIRTVAEDYFVGTEKDTKQAFLFGYNALGKEVFENRDDALQLVKKAEKSGNKDFDIYYEEY